MRLNISAAKKTKTNVPNMNEQQPPNLVAWYFLFLYVILGVTPRVSIERRNFPILYDILNLNYCLLVFGKM